MASDWSKRTRYLVVVDGHPHRTPRDGLTVFGSEEAAWDFAEELRAAGEVESHVYVRHVYANDSVVPPDPDIVADRERRIANRDLRASKQATSQPTRKHHDAVRALCEILLSDLTNEQKREAMLAILPETGLPEEHREAVRQLPVDEFVRRFAATLLN